MNYIFSFPFMFFFMAGCSSEPVVNNEENNEVGNKVDMQIDKIEKSFQQIIISGSIHNHSPSSKEIPRLHQTDRPLSIGSVSWGDLEMKEKGEWVSVGISSGGVPTRLVSLGPGEKISFKSRIGLLYPNIKGVYRLSFVGYTKRTFRFDVK
ncbi:MAG: hypothetical protein ACI9AF_000664 [Granulosicoccus sp.]